MMNYNTQNVNLNNMRDNEGPMSTPKRPFKKNIGEERKSSNQEKRTQITNIESKSPL